MKPVPSLAVAEQVLNAGSSELEEEILGLGIFCPLASLYLDSLSFSETLHLLIHLCTWIGAHMPC